MSELSSGGIQEGDPREVPLLDLPVIPQIPESAAEAESS